jgi:uncharacterized protein YjbJ (UPF0337 family)
VLSGWEAATQRRQEEKEPLNTQQQQQPAGQPTEHTGVEAVVDEAKERFAREWDSLKTRARAVFEKLSEEDVESVKGRFDELRSRVVKAYGYAEERAHEEITRLLHGGDAKPTGARPAGPKQGRKKHRGAKRHANAAARSSSH